MSEPDTDAPAADAAGNAVGQPTGAEADSGTRPKQETRATGQITRQGPDREDSPGRGNRPARAVPRQQGTAPQPGDTSAGDNPPDGALDDVAVVIPAHNEAARVSATIAAARSIPGVGLVVLVDDGSADATSELAAAAGAIVVRHGRNRGKAAAMETGAGVVGALDAREERDRPRLLLFLDADLEESAAAAHVLIPPVRDRAVDMTIAVLPPQRTAGGGHGFVVRLARDGVRSAVGFRATQPLSGQRCLHRDAFEAARPLASGFGVETGLTIDVLRAGFTAREVQAEIHHRVTGTDLRSQVHRARQYVDVARALAYRRTPESVRRLLGR
jgi:hypothetical protein